MAERLMRADPRLHGGRAFFLARSIAQRHDAGDFGWPHDRTFRKSLPSLHGRGEWCACWRRIAAPVLLLLSSDPRPDFATGDPDELAARLACFRQITARRIPNMGHNLHHHAVETVAHMVEAFFRAPDAVEGLPPALSSGTR